MELRDGDLSKRYPLLGSVGGGVGLQGVVEVPRYETLEPTTHFELGRWQHDHRWLRGGRAVHLLDRGRVTCGVQGCGHGL